MKKIFLFLTFCTCLLSCTKVIYSHQQVMEQFQTKQDVVNRFGLPSEKRSGEGIEEWLYDYETVYTKNGYGNSNTNASVYGSGNSLYGRSNTYTSNVTQFTQYSKYIKFTFDQSGNVRRWDTNVDMTARAPSTGKTILYLLIIVGVAVGLVIASGGGGGSY